MLFGKFHSAALFLISLQITAGIGSPPEAVAAPGDIVFVTQVPQPFDFANAFATFGNQLGSVDSVPRGGDLYIRYSNGTLRNLTRAAGYGVDGLQGTSAIAVRDPAVHWDGQKVIFSMVIGGASQRYQLGTYYWQLYEITGLGAGQTPVITKVPNQPENYNNVMPTYGTDDRIIFASDRPRNGERHLYPQRDEYESTATNSGLWSLDPASGNLFLLDHAPSGAFHPSIDSFGRVVYTRWDHLQRDQQADGTDAYGAFNYSGESAGSVKLNTKLEVFPEPRSEAQRQSPNLNLHSFNFFLPWQIHEDGTGLETINHVGRHELAGYFNRSFNNDPNFKEHGSEDFVTNQNELQIFLQIHEDPNSPGRYLGIRCPEFGTHASGQVVALNGAPNLRGDQMTVDYLTHPDTGSFDDSPGPGHTGMYRNPLPMSDGTIVVAHTTETREDRNAGTTELPQSRYDYRLKRLVQDGSYLRAGTALTSGIVKSLTYWSPDVLVSYNGPLWEIQPVEFKSRVKPQRLQSQVEAPEASVFEEVGVGIESFRQFLKQNDLALIVGRNVTTRDAADVQQPFNLKVPGGVSTIANGGKSYDISHLQIFQGDLLRGYADGSGEPGPGRRVLSRPMHDGNVFNPSSVGGPEGSVKVASDGSFAALVPSRRALTWQLTDPAGEGVVRERLWLTFQPGEIRVCASCHGENSHDQVGNPPPVNPPLALKQLLEYLRGATHEKPVPCDFDGDRRTDRVVSRATKNGEAKLYLNYSNGSEPTSLNFGRAADDLFVAGDVDQDRKSDLIAARVKNVAGVTFFQRLSSNSQTQNQPWGLRGDLPLAADFDGDGANDTTVYRPSDGSWWMIRSHLGPLSLYWGLPGDIAAPADYDGDGWDDIAIWRPSIGYWAVLQSSHAARTNLEDIIWKQWGLPGDHPVPGDYDGDGKSDLAVWRPSDGTWYVCTSVSGFDCSQGTATQFGLPKDIPLNGDFDGDGRADFAVWRPSDGNWYVKRSSDSVVTVTQWGLPGDRPVCVGPQTLSEFAAQ